MSMKVFRKLLSLLRKARAKEFQFAPLRMISDVKVDLRKKDRFVIGAMSLTPPDTRFMQSP